MLNCFLQKLKNFAFLPAMYDGSNFSTCLSTFVIVCQILIISILVKVNWYLIVLLLCISLMTNNVVHLFMCSWAFVSFLEKCLSKFLHIFSWVIYNFIVEIIFNIFIVYAAIVVLAFSPSSPLYPGSPSPLHKSILTLLFMSMSCTQMFFA